MRYLYCILFFVCVMGWVYLWVVPDYFVLFAAFLWAYMAVNIWANDVANSVWPAVGAKALKLKWAIVIAALWNILWAVLAWWEVVWTVKDKIIDISWFNWNVDMYIYAMIAALTAGALWLNIATYLKAPVSTTHAIVWAVMWSWIAALWFKVVSWLTVWKIVASWIISPILWGLIAAAFLFSIKKTIIFQKNKVKAARIWVPIYVAIMSWAFSTYLIIKWLKHTKLSMEFYNAATFWLIVSIVVFFVVKWYLKKKAKKIENNRDSINKLFVIPLIFWVWLLTFAHWANDVANAIWPLSGIFDAVINHGISSSVTIPLWIMFIWAFGIAIWLSLFWPRIIKTVWSEITEIDQIRAFCIALSAAVTVILASQLWLPVSSTHIAIGWIFGVWLLRELLDRKIKNPKEKYVKRSMVTKIIAAWFITVPVVAFISGWIFLCLNLIMKI